MSLFVTRGLHYLHGIYAYMALLIHRWSRDQVSSHAASLAYFSLFSLAPLMVICTTLIGLTFGKDIAQTRIIEMASLLMGKDSAQQIQTMIVNASIPKHGVAAGIISFIVLFIGASGIFTQLQSGLNAIFPKRTLHHKQTFIKFLRDRFFSLALVFSVSSLLLGSIVFSAVLSFFSKYMVSVFSMTIAMTWFLDFLLSWLGVTLLFALIYRILPDIKLLWSEVLFGSLISAFLFILGKFILGFYLGTKHIGTAFGPAGSLVVILIWLYYSAQILFLGAEIITIQKIRKNKKKKRN